MNREQIFDRYCLARVRNKIIEMHQNVDSIFVDNEETQAQELREQPKTYQQFHENVDYTIEIVLKGDFNDNYADYYALQRYFENAFSAQSVDILVNTVRTTAQFTDVRNLSLIHI